MDAHEKALEAAIEASGMIAWDHIEERMVDAIAAYLQASGLVLVPREPTKEMQRVVSANWGRRTWSEFHDVLAAFPSPLNTIKQEGKENG